jgi:thioredoxin reductase
MPTLPGFADCWGKSVVHCPYCHGYEWRAKNTGILFKGSMFFDIVKMVRNLTPVLTVFTDGKSTMTEDQHKLLEAKKIPIIETPIVSLEHRDGFLQYVLLEGGKKIQLDALYARPDFVQHCNLAEKLGCETENGLLKVDMFQKTNVNGVFAAGDNSIPGRALALSVAAGNLAGAMMNKEFCAEEF